MSLMLKLQILKWGKNRHMRYSRKTKNALTFFSMTSHAQMEQKAKFLVTSFVQEACDRN